MLGPKQVRPHDRWPSGDSRPIAVLSLEPDALEERYGFIFQETHDDLDYYALAAIDVAGEQLWLIRYRGAPQPGTVIYADAAADAGVKRDELLAILELSSADLTWWLEGEHGGEPQPD